MFGIKKEKGYTLINLVFILMIISFVASFLFKIADNNFMRRKIKHRYEDIYKVNNYEEILQKTNLIIKNNKINLSEVKDGQRIIEEGNYFTVIYDGLKKYFILKDASGVEAITLKLRSVKDEENYYLVPLFEVKI